MGVVLPSNLKNTVDIQTLHEYVNSHMTDTLSSIEGAFHVIVDTGCSNSASPFKEDFEKLVTLDPPIKLYGIGGITEATQGGILRYQCVSTTGDILTIRTFGYYNPHQNVRLFGPQAYFALRADKGCEFRLSWAGTFLKLPEGTLPCIIDKHTYMPLLACFHDVDKTAMALAGPVVLVDSPSNTNLSASQKILLRFHCRLGHLGFGHLQWFLRQGIFGAIGVQCGSKDVTPPKCEACQMGGQQKRPIHGNVHTQNKTAGLKAEQLKPGQRIFSDQYVSSLPGRNFNGRGQMQSQNNFKGGTVFCDAASGFLSIHHQVGFTAHETIRSKLTFEREASHVGNTIQSYNTDNGIYTAKEFNFELEKNLQSIRMSGVGAHHQNGPAENAIKNVSRKARIMMFHAALRWPDQNDNTLWPLAMNYAVHLHNNTPKAHDGLCPVEIWSTSKSNYSHLRNAHTWGCPVYVLDASLQDGHKIPRWNPRSRRGVFTGPPPLHASRLN